MRRALQCCADRSNKAPVLPVVPALKSRSEVGIRSEKPLIQIRHGVLRFDGPRDAKTREFPDQLKIGFAAVGWI